MAEIENVLENMIRKELKYASNYVTRSTIKLRVAKQVLDILDIPLQTIYDTKNLIEVDKTCSTAIEKSWMDSCSNNNVSSDEWAVLERFLAKDYVRNIDLVRLASVLTKKIPKRDLYCIFAIDGLWIQKYDFSLKDYFDTLVIPMEFGERNHEELENESLKNCHVRAVRTIFKHMKSNNNNNDDDEFVTPTILGNVLKKLFGIDSTTTTTTKTTTTKTVSDATKNNSLHDNDIYSSSGSSISGSDDDDDNEDENDQIEKLVSDMYKRLVGIKLYSIASWKKSEYLQRQVSINSTSKKRTNRRKLLPKQQKQQQLKDSNDNDSNDNHSDKEEEITTATATTTNTLNTTTTTTSSTEPKKKKLKTDKKKEEE